ncbi:MAG: hypothetical protein ABI903_05560 [Actinomycetota bacterium]
MRPRSSGHEKIPVPGPDSRFFVPQASSKALRWSIVFFLVGPAVLAFAVFEFALAREWTGLVIALVMLCTYSLMKWLQIHATVRELARRRSGGSNVGSGKAAHPGGSDDDAQEVERRRAAWTSLRLGLRTTISMMTASGILTFTTAGDGTLMA